MAAVRVHLDDFLQREIDLGSFPGASYAAGTVSGGIVRAGALGNAVAVPLRIPATADTIYDCASITKTLVTTVLVLQAVAEKTIALDDEYRGYTYRELLSLSSGLRAWLPLYALGDYLQAIEERGPEAPRGARAEYSDLNFVLLYFALREIFGDYAGAARERIFEPLGLRDALFHPPASLLPRIAATEWGQRFEAGMCATRSIPFHGFRQGLMWGEPNDGNSFHAGGTCGNAGLFATARDAFRIVQAFARGELVPRALVREATRPHHGDRGLGWQISDLGYGHNGFTGTSVWVRDDQMSVLLTNRIHPCAAPIAMKRIREEFHQMARV
ncbi:MAG TPA: serine hydrolase domain-containing protein [Thermoanaerobaculia bacterium]|nr:serine hydrolase domain-containing protein [Thermoanaerobaculia bacterium]